MFNKGKDPTPPRPAQPAPETPLTQSKRAMTRSGNPPSILSGDLVVSGELKSEGEVVVEGEINGDIRGLKITVGDKASVKGDVVAQEVEIRGRVIGSVRGNTVKLTATARIEGDITHSSLSVEAGAHFEGRCVHASDPLNAPSASGRDSGSSMAVASAKPAGDKPGEGGGLSTIGSRPSS